MTIAVDTWQAAKVRVAVVVGEEQGHELHRIVAAGEDHDLLRVAAVTGESHELPRNRSLPVRPQNR